MSTKKPAIVRRLEGNPARRPIEEVGIEAQGTPFIPEHLPDDARGVIEVIQRSMPPSVYSAQREFEKLFRPSSSDVRFHSGSVAEASSRTRRWNAPNKRRSRDQFDGVAVFQWRAQQGVDQNGQRYAVVQHDIEVATGIWDCATAAVRGNLYSQPPPVQSTTTIMAPIMASRP
jgi:hypothetical protein